jgi:hypothetical protein
MRMDVYTPISAGQCALIQVYGKNEPGYLKVKLNGRYVAALPDENPGVPGEHRLVFGPPSGRGFNVWTNPEWKAQDEVVFELYDSATQSLQDQKSTVII